MSLNSALSDTTLVACNWPWWEYLHHRNQWTIQTRVFSIPREPGVRHSAGPWDESTQWTVAVGVILANRKENRWQQIETGLWIQGWEVRTSSRWFPFLRVTGAEVKGWVWGRRGREKHGTRDPNWRGCETRGGRQRAGKGPKAVRRNDTGVLAENEEANCRGEVSGAGRVSKCKTFERIWELPMRRHRTNDSGHTVVTETDTALPAFWGGRQAIGEDT